MRSLGTLCVLAVFGPVWHEPVRVPYEYRKVSLGMQCGPMQMPYGLWNTLRLKSCITVWGKFRACRTHKYGRLSDHARLSTGPKSSRNRTNPQRGHPPSLIRVFAMRLIAKQRHKTSSYEHRSLIKLSSAHMPFRFCRAQVQKSQLLRKEL